MKSNHKKSIVMLIPQVRNGGAERVVSRLSFLLREHYKLYIVVFESCKNEYKVGCEVVSLEVKPVASDNTLIRAINVLKRIYYYRKFKAKYNIDITYSFGDTANIVNILSLGSDRKITSVRGYKKIKRSNTIFSKILLRPMTRYLYNSSDVVVTVSNLIKKTLISEYGIKSGKIATIYNGYDIKNIQSQASIELSEEEQMLFHNSHVIITAGTYRSEKGYWHLLKAFSLARAHNHQLKLVIIGEDYCGYKEKVKRLAKELNIDEYVALLGFQTNPFKYFMHSDIYVLSSTSEGFPNALVEAMVCGLPVIASDCRSGPREILAPNTNITKNTERIELAEYGILVKPMTAYESWSSDVIEDCDSFLADAIITILNDGNLRELYKARSHIRARDFGYDTWKSEHIRILN